MSDIIPSSTETVDPRESSPREITRQNRIDVLRRAGYSEARLAALEGVALPPQLANDLIVETDIDLMADPVTKWRNAEREG